ncbi:MAG TPA: alpha-glucan family phosphorylase [Atribacteraceae bacterium]|nr:alpha-glucan family phosphorylase [Atribacteraceae bacterium]
MMEILNKLRHEQAIAYFSMEIALFQDIPTYSGGLGVLAGDTVRSAADLSIPFVAVTLLSRKGYFQQTISPEGQQQEIPAAWAIEKFLKPLFPQVFVTIGGKKVWIRAWAYHWRSIAGGIVPVIFLDTDLEKNDPEDRTITDYLYGGDQRYRLKQEIVLGVGGARILEKLGVKVRKYHINEGHAALLTLDLLKKHQRRLEEVWDESKIWDIQTVRDLCVFTTHTPVEAGHDKFDYGLVRREFEELVPFSILQELGGRTNLNMTLLALNLSGYVNGVAKKHSEVSRHMFPGYSIQTVTNGVHSFTWTAPAFRKLYDSHIPGWAHEPELLSRVDIIPDKAVWDAHQAEKAKLIDLVRKKTGHEFKPENLTLGFARRITAYKRPYLLFSNLERLRKVTRQRPLQIVYAGKAHPQDEEGKRIIHHINTIARTLQDSISVAYIEDYGFDIARKIIAGVDVWLNTPEIPMEASGTSGMKAAHNGVLNFSVLDGWWMEGCIEGITGWAIGREVPEHDDPSARIREELDDLYNKLEYIIFPTYYQQIDTWIKLMKNSIGKIASYFNSHRMMKRYITDAYFHQSFPTKFLNGTPQLHSLIK